MIPTNWQSILYSPPLHTLLAITVPPPNPSDSPTIQNYRSIYNKRVFYLCQNMHRMQFFNRVTSIKLYHFNSQAKIFQWNYIVNLPFTLLLFFFRISYPGLSGEHVTIYRQGGRRSLGGSHVSTEEQRGDYFFAKRA